MIRLLRHDAPDFASAFEDALGVSTESYQSEFEAWLVEAEIRR